MAYDPLNKTKQFPDAIIKEHFGKTSNSVKANRLANENPELHRQMRAQAVEMDLVPAQNGFRERGMRLGTVNHPPDPERQFDSQTLLAMARFPKAACERWYKGQLTSEDMELFHSVVTSNPDAADKLPSISRLQREAPELFAILQSASVAHRVIADVPRNQSQAQGEVKPADDGRVNLGDKLGAVVGLPGSYRVTVEEYNDVLQFAAAQAK